MKEFKLIVAGGRDFNDYKLLSAELMKLASTTWANRDVSIVSGMARGADSLAVRFAQEHNVQLYKFPADWNKHGKGAGFMRNEAMAEFADGLLAFWDSKSRGTGHMVGCMNQRNKWIRIVEY